MKQQSPLTLAFFLTISLSILGCSQDPASPDAISHVDRDGLSQRNRSVAVKITTCDKDTGVGIASHTMTNIPGCEAVIIRGDDFYDRVCGDDDWIAFPDHLQYCDEPIYYQNDDGKVAICAAEDCDLSLRQQFELYQYASGTASLPGDGS